MEFSKADGGTILGKHENLKMLITKEFSVMSIGLKLSDKGVELGF